MSTLTRTTSTRTHLGRVSLLAWQIAALGGQVAAVHLSRLGYSGTANALSSVSMATVLGSVVWVLTGPHLTRRTRNLAVACLAVTPALMSRATDPLLFTGFDEQLHMRTLADIIASHHFFEANPVLEISPRYPGLEAVTVLLHELGLPTMLAALLGILSARLVLVTVLCDAVEQLTDSARAGGLAVAHVSSEQDIAYGVAVQSDGKIVLSGGGTPAGGRNPTMSKNRARSGWQSQSRMARAWAGLPASRRRRRDSRRSSRGWM